MQQSNPIPNLDRVVMLGPPNQGSEVVDILGNSRLFRWINGPAGRQLGTGPQEMVNQLGPVDFELGIIAGDRSLNWILSMMIPGRDDGKVAVERARLAGMKAFKVVHATHPFLMSKKSVRQDIVSFLRWGRF